jgi:acyl-CoA thioesterase
MSEKRREDIDLICGREPVEDDFRRRLGITNIIVDDNGYYAIELKVRPMHLNRMKIVHGGLLFTLCDSAAGNCVVLNGMNCVTQEGSIHYYSPAREGDTLLARAEIRKQGQTSAVANVEVTDQNGKLIADSTFTLFRKK